jgi:lipopolysaccharide export system protein LptA
MVSDQASSTVEFTGNVVAKREDGTIRADHIKLFFKDKEKPGGENKQNLERIEASGGVVYETGERKAFADKAVYTIADEVLVLTGKSTRVVTGRSHVTGSTITLYQKSGKVIVEGGSDQRVEMLLNPGELRKSSGD